MRVSAMVALVVAGGMVAAAQLTSQRAASAVPLAFEVGTIKPAAANSPVGGGCRGIDSRLAPDDPRTNVPLGRCVLTARRLSHLMAIAYEMPLTRISGFPEWDTPNRFDVQAKAEDPGATTEHQLLLMLQQFLTDQFKLSVHREAKDGPTFSLVAAKNGPKNLHPSDANSETLTTGGTKLLFRGYSMKSFAEFASEMPTVLRPVTDMTGLDGRFDFSLEMLESPSANVVDAKLAMSRWETIFSDLQEQLGLRLEPARGAVDTLVIDHAELPRVE